VQFQFIQRPQAHISNAIKSDAIHRAVILMIITKILQGIKYSNKKQPWVWAIYRDPCEYWRLPIGRRIITSSWSSSSNPVRPETWLQGSAVCGRCSCRTVLVVVATFNEWSCIDWRYGPGLQHPISEGWKFRKCVSISCSNNLFREPGYTYS